MTFETFYARMIEIFEDNFPSRIAGWIDLYKHTTVLQGTTTTLISFTVPATAKRGVIKSIGFGYVSGNIIDLSFKATINGFLFPQTFNTAYQSDIMYPIYNLDNMHLDIKANDKIIITSTNSSTLSGDDSEIWTRCKGWYY